MIIKVKDINDEPPYFINRPLPMQAVVKLNAPPNTPVFTLQAKDPDTDHNLSVSSLPHVASPSPDPDPGHAPYRSVWDKY